MQPGPCAGAPRQADATGRRRRLAGGIACLLTALANIAIAQPIPEYPRIDGDEARYSLAVVEVLEEDYLPPFPECGNPDVVCMDPPPTWFRGRVLAPVHGDAPSAEFIAATTNHMGPGLGPEEGAEPVPRLMVLMSDGRSMVMPRYASGELHRDASGGFHLVIWDDFVHGWLPCGATAAIAPISDETLARAAAVPRERFWTGQEGLDSAFVRERDGMVIPRFSIPITQLRAWLAQATSLPADLSCRSEGED